MPEPFESDETESIVTLESLPAGCLSIAQIDTLGESDAIELAAPCIIDTTTSRVTHFDLVYDDTHHFLGWNPTNEQWEQILVAVDTEDEPILESAIAVYDDESGEVVVGFDPSDTPEIPDIVEYVWEYAEYTYPQADDLYNVMDEALEELPADDQ